MTKHKTPKWILSANWGVSSDQYNFILYRKSGDRWIAKGFHPSIESLLHSLYRKLTRSEPTDPDLVKHVEAASERVEACAEALFDQLDAEVMLRGMGLSPREVSDASK
ncbi:hypothetical protein ACFL07_00945 [Pseudomonadota bacterium]